MDIFKNVQKPKNEKSLGKTRFFQRHVTRMQRKPKKCKIVCYHHFFRILVGIFFGYPPNDTKKMPKNAEFLDHVFYDDIWCAFDFVVNIDSLDDTQMIPKKNAE